MPAPTRCNFAAGIGSENMTNRMGRASRIMSWKTIHQNSSDSRRSTVTLDNALPKRPT